MATMEDLINECGGFGKFQIMIVVGLSIHFLSIGWSMLQMSYAGFTPNWYCLPGSLMDNSSYYTNETFKECSLNNSLTGYEKKDCHSHYFEGCSETVVTEWDLVCRLEGIKATITSIQMTGVFIGCVLSGQLSNLFGRKKTTFGFSLLHALLNIGAAFATSWEMFAAFRFLIGTGIGAILVVVFPYSMEFLPTKWRPIMAALPAWQISVAIFSLAAYFIEHWAYLHIACGVLSLPILLGYFYVPESLRWLALKGYIEEAEAIFEKMATVNGKPSPKQTRAVLEQISKEEKESHTKGKEYTYRHLFIEKRQTIMTLIFSYLWFTMSAVFYGISFGVSALSGNLYLNIFLLSIVGLPIIISTFYFTNRFGRKLTAIVPLAVAAVSACGCLIVYYAVSSEYRGRWITGLSLVCKMGLEVAWVVTSTWANESYPTAVRSLGYGVINAAARVGGIIAPFAIDLENETFAAYSVITAMLLVATVSSFFIADTKGKAMVDNIIIPISCSEQQGDTKLSVMGENGVDVENTISPTTVKNSSMTKNSTEHNSTGGEQIEDGSKVNPIETAAVYRL